MSTDTGSLLNRFRYYYVLPISAPISCHIDTTINTQLPSSQDMELIDMDLPLVMINYVASEFIPRVLLRD